MPPWFVGNPNVGRRNAKLRRLERKGKLPTKDQLAEWCRDAMSPTPSVPSRPVTPLPVASRDATLGFKAPR